MKLHDVSVIVNDYMYYPWVTRTPTDKILTTTRIDASHIRILYEGMTDSELQNLRDVQSTFHTDVTVTHGIYELPDKPQPIIFQI